MNPMHSSPEDIFRRLLDESSALLGSPQDAGVTIPDDELHRDILLPLLPAMLGDGAIRKHWHDQAATGFLARLARHLEGGAAAPLWQPADFEIHVAASYSAGPDAKALADTLLSEESLRDLSAALMNHVLDSVWPKLELPAAEDAISGAEAPMEAIEHPLPEIAPAEETAVDISPVPEPVVAVAKAEFAASAVTRTAAWPPPPSTTVPRPCPRWGNFRAGRENPISGAKAWRGKIGEPDWSHTYPLAGGTSHP